MQRKMTRLALAAKCGIPDKPPVALRVLVADRTGLAKLAKGVAP